MFNQNSFHNTLQYTRSMNTKYLLWTPNSHTDCYLLHITEAISVIQFLLTMATSSSMLCGELWAITWKEQIFLVWKLKVNYLNIFGGKKKNQSVLQGFWILCTWGSVSNLLVSSISQGNINIKLHQIQS